MAESITKRRYSWKEKYGHVLTCYCSLFNYALKYIAEKYGEKDLDEFLGHAMSIEVLGASTLPGLKEGVDTEAFLKSYIPHHLMIGSEIRVEKATPNEIIVQIVKCGSKNMLTEKYGSAVAKYYCRHCEFIPIFEQRGWRSETKRTNARILKGENIGCTRIFKKIRH